MRSEWNLNILRTLRVLRTIKCSTSKHICVMLGCLHTFGHLCICVTFFGCVLETFWTNPQFRVRIEEIDKECASGQCPENILVSLMQKHENRYRSLVSNYFIGFSVLWSVLTKVKEYNSFGVHLLMVCYYSIFYFNRYHQGQVNLIKVSNTQRFNYSINYI